MNTWPYTERFNRVGARVTGRAERNEKNTRIGAAGNFDVWEVEGSGIRSSGDLRSNHESKCSGSPTCEAPDRASAAAIVKRCERKGRGGDSVNTTEPARARHVCPVHLDDCRNSPPRHVRCCLGQRMPSIGPSHSCSRR
jgi:hypothetical protein